MLHSWSIFYVTKRHEISRVMALLTGYWRRNLPKSAVVEK